MIAHNLRTYGIEKKKLIILTCFPTTHEIVTTATVSLIPGLGN